MQCKHHPDRSAEFFCASCNGPLCKECVKRLRRENITVLSVQCFTLSQKPEHL